MADRDRFGAITPPPPNDPRIKEPLGGALTRQDTPSPGEVRKIAASPVYHLSAQRRT